MLGYKVLYVTKKILLTLFVFATLLTPQQNLCAESDDIYEDSAAFGFDFKQEKEDETFFYFGRFLMLGAEAGLRTFTGNLGTIYDPGLVLGGHLTYFMTLGFSLEFLLEYSWHNYIVDNTSGSLSLLNVDLLGKYYITSTTFTRALVYANPYIFAGIGQYVRFFNSANFPSSGKDASFGFPIGAGFEFPVIEKSFYVGLKFIFHWILFKDEDQTSTGGASLNGDAISIVSTLTYNF